MVDGAPAVGAEVLLLRGSDLGRGGTVRTSRDGTFAQPASLAGEDHVFAVAVVGGTARAGSGPIDLRAPKPVKLTVPPSARFEGKVVDADGTAVDAHVSLHVPWRFMDGCNRSGFVPTILPGHYYRTLDGGTFSFSGSDSGQCLIWAVPVDAGLPPGRVAVRPGEAIVVVLGHGLQQSVHAVGAVAEMRTGRALQDVDIEVVRAQGMPAIGTLEGRSRPDGTFELRGIAPGRFHLRFSRKGYAFHRTAMAVHEAGELPLNVELLAARLVRVQVVDPSGLGLRDLYVEVRDAAGRIVELQDEGGRWQADAVATDGNGRADLRGVPAEQIRIVVRDAGVSGPGDAILGELAVDLVRPPTGLLQVRAVRR
jgi:hypothetical protein